jgi:hypothetical protein
MPAQSSADPTVPNRYTATTALAQRRSAQKAWGSVSRADRSQRRLGEMARHRRERLLHRDAIWASYLADRSSAACRPSGLTVRMLQADLAGGRAEYCVDAAISRPVATDLSMGIHRVNGNAACFGWLRDTLA